MHFPLPVLFLLDVSVYQFFFGAIHCGSWSYSTALAYIVDANQGRSSAAVATNGAFRGLVPL